ncbi:MAG: class I adenylate cyclase [Methylomonas sp.]
MNPRFSPIHLGAPGEEISKKDLHAIAQRFKNFNQSRLQRVQDFFQGRQHDFLNLLPLIFHVNHPLLPGFVSLETPAGIPDYSPNKQTVDTAKQFSKGFMYKRQALRSYPIQSIFLMGSVGSMAFSKDSDIDIWLCHQPSLTAAELDELRQKTYEVEKWAASLKIEVHFFLVNSQQFKQGQNAPISAESSGEAQHYLLLEEFYRTAIYIAGRMPVWWLVPPSQEKHYAQYVAHLLENRFISEMDIIDFGGLQDMPMAEFVSATLWQIYKSLTSPHKSLLKLLLMESYASEFPDPQWLCNLLKQSIYQGDFSVDSLDPYLLIYSKVERYLKDAGSKQRLNLARECFHLKIMGSSVTALDSRARQLHEEYLESIAEQWQWPDDLLENLGLQKYWNIDKASAEHAVIRDQLQQCLRIILKFAGIPVEHDYQENNDLNLISRKLRAVLDLRPGQVEMLTTRGMVHAKPDVLSFVELEQSGAGSHWCLYTDNMTGQSALPEFAIKRADSFDELLCWAVVNGLYKKSINLKLISSSLALSVSELSMLLAELHDFISRYLFSRNEDLEVYENPNRILSSLLLINLGEALAIDSNDQQFVMSERSDPFSYGESRQCFVQRVEKISVSNWGEVTLQRYDGLSGFFACIAEVFNDSEPPIDASKLRVICFTKGRGRSIALRINTLFDNLLKCFADRQSHQQLRYILAGESGYYVIRSRDNVLTYYLLDTHNQLLQELGSAQPQFSPVWFDSYVLEQTFIPSLYQYNLADIIQIFYHATAKHVAVYVIDEKGALFVAQHSKANPEHVLIHYSLFFGSLLVQAKLPAAKSVKCYEIQKNSTGVVSCQSVQVKPENSAMDLRVRITAEQAPDSFAVYCNDLKFSIVDAQTYAAVKNHILSFRKNRDDYPCHITEIDVPCRMLGIEHASQAQGVHYLNYKQKIEDKLNLSQ